MLRILKIIDHVVVRTALAAAIIMLALMTVASFYQVITRFVFEQPSIWSEVIARTLNIWMIYLGLAAACRAGVMMAVDTLMTRLTGTVRITLLVIVASLSIGMLLMLVWYGYEMAVRVRFQALAGLKNPVTGNTISISWMYAALPIGALLAIFGVFAKVVEDIQTLTSAEENDKGFSPPSPPIQEL